MFGDIANMKEVLYAVRCLKSSEDMILALAGQFKQLSHDIAKDERIVAHLEKMFGLKITRGDGLPSRRCRSCYVKISKIQAFVKMIFESKAQQESVVRAKRGKSVGDSPTSATSRWSKREKRKSKVYQRKVQETSSKRFIAVKGYKSTWIGPIWI